MRRTLVLALALATTGCAFDAGEPYGSLEATVLAHYDQDADRELGGGWQKLASGYALTLDEAVLGIEAMELISASSFEVLTFDPANPPAGFGACHGGHCHSDDGELVSYEEIEAQLAGGGGGTVALSLAVGRLDLLTGAQRALGCPGRCLLGRGRVVRLRLRLDSVRLRGRVRDGLEPARLPGEQPFVADLALGVDRLPTVDLAVSLDLPLDDDNPSQIGLDVELAAGAGLLDDTVFADLVGEPLVPLDLGADEDATHALVTRLGELVLHAETTRSDP